MLGALAWLDSWSSLGAIVVGMRRLVSRY